VVWLKKESRLEAVKPMHKIKSQKVSDQVYEQLLGQITNRTWKEGSKLPSENELRTLLGVSRISVRAAIHRLTALGLVETRQGEGTFVRKVTADTYSDLMMPMFLVNKNTIKEILEYRLVMEVGAIELAAARITEAELDALEEIVVRMEANTSDIKTFAEDDVRFHVLIAKASKNQMIINVMNFMYDLMDVSMESIVNHLGMHDGKYYHRLILQELRTGNQAAAVNAMREHVAKTVDRINEVPVA